MKRIIVVVFYLLSFLAQAEDPVKWSFTLSSQEIHVGDTIEVVAKAAIIPDWYLYSNDFDPNLGPTITEFKFAADQGYQLIGKPKAIKPKKKFDPIWEGDVTYFTEHGEFRQKIVILNTTPKISFSVNFQTCTEGKCIPGEEEFIFSGLTVLPARKKSTTGAVETSKTIKTPEQTVEKSSLQKLEADKAKLIQRDKNGNDVSVDYLKNFVNKYGK
jgi:hypothetical protein